MAISRLCLSLPFEKELLLIQLKGPINLFFLTIPKCLEQIQSENETTAAKHTVFKSNSMTNQ